MKKTAKRSSDTLLDIANNKDLKGELTYKRFLSFLGKRAFGVVLLFFGLLSALPVSVIPGFAVIFSVPILLFACQMIFARKTIWLPTFLANRTIPHDTISKVIHTTVPYLIKMEYFLKPRWLFMNTRFMEIMTGCVIFCLAVLLMLPIPFSNFIFAGLLIIFSLGLIEKDGILLSLGYLATIVYLSFIYLFIKTAIKHLFN